MSWSARRGQVRKRVKKDGTTVWDAIAYEGRGPDGKRRYRWVRGHQSPADAERALADLHAEVDTRPGVARGGSR